MEEEGHMITALELEALVEEATVLLKDACVIPAPSHHEEQRVDFITSWLRKEGVEDFHVDEAMNFIISINDDGACPLDVFAAHTDVVFPDTTALPMREDGSLLHCPGVGDDTASFVALMLYARALQRGDIKAMGGVLCVCNTCEEGLGNLKGVHNLNSLKFYESCPDKVTCDDILCQLRMGTSSRSKRCSRTLVEDFYTLFLIIREKHLFFYIEYAPLIAKLSCNPLKEFLKRYDSHYICHWSSPIYLNSTLYCYYVG